MQVKRKVIETTDIMGRMKIFTPKNKESASYYFVHILMKKFVPEIVTL